MNEPASGKRFEVSVLRDKRWLIDCLAHNEFQARARAEELYADDDVQAVRVVRGRFGHDGTSYETVILERAREGRRGERPVKIAASPDEVAWCDSIDDLYGPASRYAIARLLRNFLDRHCITPTELLHHNRYQRLLERQDELLPQAVQRVAAHQAKARGVDGRQRLDMLDRWVNEATSRARDALASRAAPRFGEGGMVALEAAVAALTTAPGERAFHLRLAVSRAFEEVAGFMPKLEAVMGWAAADPSPVVLALIDELTAGLLGAASLVQEALGPQTHLASALGTLADLATGRAEGEKTVPPALAPLATLMGRAAMPETRQALTDRLLREFATEKPLSRDNEAGQRRLFDALVEKLADERGLFMGGGAMVEAIARRSRRFGIVGGVEAVTFKAPDPIARLEQLTAAAGEFLTERQQRAIAHLHVGDRRAVRRRSRAAGRAQAEDRGLAPARSVQGRGAGPSAAPCRLTLTPSLPRLR